MHDRLSRALLLLASGQLDEARIYLEELLRQDPENTDLLYNLGLCYVDLGQLDQGRELLHRCLQLAPEHSHAYVALGVACQKKGDLPRAKEDAMQALAADPRNPVALKNLGAINGQEGDSLRALYYQATVLRDRSQGPADRVRPRLRPLTLRHRAGAKAFPGGAGEREVPAGAGHGLLLYRLPEAHDHRRPGLLPRPALFPPQPAPPGGHRAAAA